MGAPRTLKQVGRWADEMGLEAVLARPYEQAFDACGLTPPDRAVLRLLAEYAGVSTLGELLGADHLNLDRTLARLLLPAQAAALVERLRRGLLRAGDDIERDFDEDEDFEDDEDEGATGSAPPPAIALAAASVEPVPHDLAKARAWAERYRVADRLADPASVLAPFLYGGDVYAQQAFGDAQRTVADMLDPWVPHRTARMPRWEQAARARSANALALGARRYLFEAARTCVAVESYRRALSARARPPAEPPLAALAERIEAALTELRAHVAARSIGTYRPSPATVEEGPLRIVYGESTSLAPGTRTLRVTIDVEQEPLRASCDCEQGRGGRCVHAIAAFEAALDLLHDPDSGPRRVLAETLAVPAWERFLDAFGKELARRERPAPPEDLRVAWRVGGDGAHLSIEPLVQRRLKNGGWSVGQRTRPEELERRGLLSDAHDARVFAELMEGLEEAGSTMYVTPSRARLVRTLDALAGHPRVLLVGSAVAPARVARERIRVVLEHDAEGVGASLSLGGRPVAAAELARLSAGSDVVVVMDPAAGTITLCAVDERARALLAALAKHPARFPPESHDRLLRSLAALQESVDLVMPEALAGEPVEADARPILRLSPLETGQMDVEVLVRPIEGGPDLRPGEGPDTVFHVIDGRRVAARRDRAREVAIAAELVERLAPARGEAPAWSFCLEEEPALDLIAALRDLGDAVAVEWPEKDKRVVVAGVASRKELRIRVTDRRDWFGVEGEVDVDGDAVPLSALLDAVRRGRRYVRVGPGKFAQIEEDLRRRVMEADDVLHPGRHGLEVALPGVAQLSDLVDDPRHIEAAARWRELVRRIDAARALDPALPEGLAATLRPYQIEGYKWLARLSAWGSGACLADDMGLGKTVQTLALLLARKERGPALVIAPTSVGPNWIREAERFAPGLSASLYRGPGRAALLEEAGPGALLVTSYALAVRDAEALAKVRFGSIVLDEAQAIKNALTHRARAVRDLDAELRVALTGTPVENHLGELWSLMRVVAPGLLGSWDHFRDRFAGPIERGRDAARSAALARLVRPFLLRRTKAEVAPELPPRIEIERFVDLSAAERRLYDEARREAIESLATAGGGDARFALLAALTRLRRLACHPRLLDDGSTVPSSKLAAVLDVVRELREEGHRALIFSQFTSHLALVREALGREGITFEYLDGATPAEERSRRIDAFQAGRSDVFLISLKAGGTGLNLTAADYVLHLDPWWNPAVEDQATDRAHRIGQTKAVTVIRLIARGTIEEAVLALHGDKRALAASVFDEEGGAARLSTDELAALIRAGVADAPMEEDSDAAGDEEVQSGSVDAASPVKREATARPAARKKTGEAATPASVAHSPTAPTAGDALVAAVIGYVAEQRGIADPRYHATMRVYERSLRRFTEYLASRRVELGEGPIDDIVMRYLTAVRDGSWPVPSSEQSVARTALNHLKAYLKARRR